MRHTLLRTTILFFMAFPAGAETGSCAKSNVTVDASDATLSEMTCKAAEHATLLFERCNVPSLSGSVHINIVDNLELGCVALYHCGEDWVEVLAPSSIAAIRDPDGAFGFLRMEEYFRSVIVHELAHAAFDSVACPFASCVTGNEYVAYNMQVMSMTPQAQSKFAEIAGLDRKISRDELSPANLFMAPNLFAQKAWTHLSQRDDSCEFIGQITDGTVLLDREHF